MSEANISFRCQGCEALISFPGTDAGTVQECPECGGWADVPELTRSPELNDPYAEEQARLFAEAVRQNAENVRLLEMSENSHEEWRRQLNQSARDQEQAEEAFGRFASLISRWEELTGRLEKALKRLEQSDL